MTPVRALIVASSPLLRAGLRSMLAEASVEVVGEAATLALSGERPDAEVLIVADEDPAGAGLTEELVETDRASAGRSLVLISSDETAVSWLRELPLSGWGIVSPDAPPEELQAAVAAAARGLVVFERSLVERLTLAPEEDGEDEAPSPLTGRETEVLELLSRGLPNKQVARRLDISEHTVKFHVSSIFAKLGASSRAEAVALGARRGAITL